MPPVHTCATRDQAAISTAESPSVREAELDAEIDADLCVLSEAAEVLISDGSVDSGSEHSFNPPGYTPIRRQTTLDEDIQSTLLRSTGSSTDAESAGYQGVIDDQTSHHQNFSPSSSVPSPVPSHQSQGGPSSTHSLGLITSRILVLEAYLDPNPASSQLSPRSIAQLYDSLSVADAIRLCYFLREWGYSTRVRMECGTGDANDNGRVVLTLTTWDGEIGQRTDWGYVLVGRHPSYDPNR